MLVLVFVGALVCRCCYWFWCWCWCWCVVIGFGVGVVLGVGVGVGAGVGPTKLVKNSQPRNWSEKVSTMTETRRINSV